MDARLKKKREDFEIELRKFAEDTLRKDLVCLALHNPTAVRNFKKLFNQADRPMGEIIASLDMEKLDQSLQLVDRSLAKYKEVVHN